MKKRRHHYVWRYYLKAWTVDEKIWCLRNGKIFQTNPINVGIIKDFYILNELSPKDIEFLMKAFIEKQTGKLKELNLEWINIFNKIFALRTQLESNNLLLPEIEQKIEEYIYNLEEDLHAKIEFDSINYIKYILNEDISFYSQEEDKIKFLHFLCVQYVRTSGLKQNAIDSIKSNDIMNINNVWNVLSHIIATSIAWTLCVKKDDFVMILLINNTTKDFITGDQPVINTYASVGKSDNPPEELEFYYPFSPKYSIVITKKEEYHKSNKINVSQDEVDRYNDLIANHSHGLVFASSKNCLMEFL